MPIRLNNNHFINFSSSIESVKLPSAFTYPFSYQPHQLAKIATKELQEKLTQLLPNPSEIEGRMYGVLVVKNEKAEIGYLAAVSGTNTDKEAIAGQNVIFVPPIFKGFDQKDYFNQCQIAINDMTASLEKLEHNTELSILKKQLIDVETESEFTITAFQKRMVERRKVRKIKRAHLEVDLTTEAKTLNRNSYEKAQQVSIELARESVSDKKHLTSLKSQCQEKISAISILLDKKLDTISELKKSRRQLSNKLQKLLFKQYQLLNISGETRAMLDIFRETPQGKPPAGSGDCAAPKLLQWAFEHNFTPLCMAEFWWGQAPKSEVRKHLHYYPSCQGKCQPILSHMLLGMKVDPNPLLVNPAENIKLEIVYSDDHLVIVNKPAGLLSVPGINIEDSVYTRIRQQFPKATGSLIVHRLDMATSGLLMLALSERAHKSLQKQFINKEITKKYVAIIEGVLPQDTGIIALPLITNIEDRPRQKVCFKEGKRAETRWRVINRTAYNTRVELFPITGRTHQLRVHCAHDKGLNMPIKGDSLYGTVANRLHLHAQYLQFSHPISKEIITFEVTPDF